MMLQQERPVDHVFATGVQYSVHQFIEAAAAEFGIALEWRGREADEIAVVLSSPAESAAPPGQVIVRTDPRYLRPTEAPNPMGDASKARRELGWQSRTSFEGLVKEMVETDLAMARSET